MARKYQIVESVPKEFGAGAKAPADSYVIAEKCGFSPIHVRRSDANNIVSKVISRILWTVRSVAIVMTTPSDSIIFIQYPMHYLRSRIGIMFLEWLWKFRKVKFITLIHDINQLRGTASALDDEFLGRVMKVTSVMIVHNESMLSWMGQYGMLRDKMVNLEIFDYLTDSVPEVNEVGDFRHVTLAGNLGLWGKCPFIKQLKDITDVEWELYGSGFDAEKSGGPNIHYHGSFPADEVTKQLTMGFGLVWDGDSVDTCSGGWGEYLRYNNPHKMSMYLSAGLPVVIWSEAAQAAFVEKYKVGFTVKSLREIGERLRQMSQSDYEQYKKNVKQLSGRLIAGMYLASAFCAADRAMGVGDIGKQ